MNPTIIQLWVALVITALIASLRSSSLAADTPDGLAIAKDPCALALLPREGSDKVDRQIMRLQSKVRNASEPTAWLDQLGWAFVAKARVSFDPGFYQLAEQCAWCLDAKKPGCAEALLLRAHVLNSFHKFKEARQSAHPDLASDRRELGITKQPTKDLTKEKR